MATTTKARKKAKPKAKAATIKVSPAALLKGFIERFAPEEQKLIRSVRLAVRKRVPTANELLYDYGSFFAIAYSPTEKPMEAILTITARPTGVQLHFNHGKTLPDPEKLLRGSGRQTRFIAVASARDLADPAVQALIAAAIRLAPMKLSGKEPGKLIARSV